MEDTRQEILIALLSKMQDGDLTVFDEFFTMTKNALYYSIIAVLRDESMSEDIMQDAYIRFLENVRTIQPNKNPLGYLLKIGRNLAIDYQRKQQKESYLEEYENPDVYGAVDPEGDDDFERIQAKMQEILRPEEYEIVILHVINELSHKEIAEILKKPLGTITWTYRNAIKKLEKGLSEYAQD